MTRDEALAKALEVMRSPAWCAVPSSSPASHGVTQRVIADALLAAHDAALERAAVMCDVCYRDALACGEAREAAAAPGLARVFRALKSPEGPPHA